MEVEDISVQLRPYDNGDRNFVLKTWLRSFRKYHTKSPDEVYYPNQQDVIDRVFERPTARCVIACDSADPTFIFAFFVAETYVTADPREPLILHFGFTKLSYRRQGVASHCLQSLGWHPERTVHITHWTRFCERNSDRFHLYQNDYFLRGYERGRFATHNQSRFPAPGNAPLGEGIGARYG